MLAPLLVSIPRPDAPISLDFLRKLPLDVLVAASWTSITELLQSASCCLAEPYNGLTPSCPSSCCSADSGSEDLATGGEMDDSCFCM